MLQDVINQTHVTNGFQAAVVKDDGDAISCCSVVCEESKVNTHEHTIPNHQTLTKQQGDSIRRVIAENVLVGPHMIVQV
jgi:hypothetical protein